MRTMFRRWLIVAAATALLTSCSLLPGSGTTKTDWAGLAQQIVTAAGSDQVTNITVSAYGQLSLTMRTSNADTSWITADGMAPRAFDDQTHVPASAIAVSDIDWAALTAAQPPDCPNGTVQVFLLPAGQHYQLTTCQPGDVPTGSIDGTVLPPAVTGDDANVFALGLQCLTPLLPGGQAMEFGKSLATFPGGVWVTGPLWTLADGSQVYPHISFLDDSTPGAPIGLTGGQLVSPAAVPFDPNDHAPAAYAAATAEGLAAAVFPPSEAVAVVFYQETPDQVSYRVSSLLVDASTGTLND